MRILFTNNTLDDRAGTELYVLENAQALKARGHEVAAFTLEPGKVGAALEAAGIPVTDDPGRLPFRPEVIHGHHAIETTLAAMTLRTVPVISFCHGPEAWQEAPCRLPNVMRWAAVDEACCHRLVAEEEIPSARVTLLLNSADTDLYLPRPALPPRPARALIFSNALHPEHPVTQAITEACEARGVVVEGRGAGFGQVSSAPWDLLPGYDLVFAKARCALEALATGCAVVQADHFGAGRLVTPDNYGELRPLNFGFKSMTFPPTAEHFGTQIDAYNAQACAAVSARVREEASLRSAVDRLEALYAETAALRPEDYDPATAAAAFLRFHLYLSKRAMDTLIKTKGVPLRLPVPGNADTAGLTQRQLWEKVRTGHVSGEEHHRSSLQSQLENRNARITGLKTKLAEAKESASIYKDRLRLEKEKRRQADAKPRGWKRWFGFS